MYHFFSNLFNIYIFVFTYFAYDNKYVYISVKEAIIYVME